MRVGSVALPATPMPDVDFATKFGSALFARPRMLGERLGNGADNVLLLRHFAAALVIAGHGYALAAQTGEARDVLSLLLPGFYAGSIAVCAFFAISGCLVTHAWLRRQDLWHFVKARVLRIYPAYAVCLFVTAVVIGPAFTVLPLQEYLLHAQTRDYLSRNVDLAGLAYTLPGVFSHNPVPEVVNGSLWSLALEARTYLILIVLAALRLLGRPRVFTALVLIHAMVTGWGWLQQPPHDQDKGALTVLFMATALAATHAHRLPVSTRLLVALGAVAWLIRGTGAFVPVAMLTIGYFTLWFAWRLPAWRLPWRGDYSYGLFLYGFPVQQVLVAVYPQITPPWLGVCALPVTLLVAIASWHWVEQPMLRLKQSRSLSPAPTP